jgi:hypothetical protein
MNNPIPELSQAEFDALNEILEVLTTEGMYDLKNYIQKEIDETESEMQAIKRGDW